MEKFLTLISLLRGGMISRLLFERFTCPITDSDPEFKDRQFLGEFESVEAIPSAHYLRDLLIRHFADLGYVPRRGALDRGISKNDDRRICLDIQAPGAPSDHRVIVSVLCQYERGGSNSFLRVDCGAYPPHMMLT